MPQYKNTIILESIVRDGTALPKRKTEIMELTNCLESISNTIASALTVCFESADVVLTATNIHKRQTVTKLLRCSNNSGDAEILNCISRCSEACDTKGHISSSFSLIGGSFSSRRICIKANDPDLMSFLLSALTVGVD